MSNYVLGSGEVYLDLRNAITGALTGERYLGVTSEFNLSIASQSVEHFDTDHGIATKDDSALISLTRTGNFKGSDISPENMALFIVGGLATITQTAVAVVAGVVNGGVALIADRYYQLGVSTINPTGVKGVTAVALKTGATTYVAGTDYVLDAALGRFHVVIGSPMATAIVTSDYTPVANTRTQVATSSLATLEGALRFKAFNARGLQRDVYIPSARITGNGDFALKGNTYQEVGFNLEINQLNADTAHIYIDGRPV